MVATACKMGHVVQVYLFLFESLVLHLIWVSNVYGYRDFFSVYVASSWPEFGEVTVIL